MEDKIEFEELYKAYELCLKNKKKKIDTYNFTNEELCMNLILLLDELNNRTYKPKHSNCYVVTEPALREIFAAQFGDRIVQHFYMMEVEDVLENMLIDGCCSCRKGKGPSYALNMLKNFLIKTFENKKQLIDNLPLIQNKLAETHQFINKKTKIDTAYHGVPFLGKISHPYGYQEPSKQVIIRTCQRAKNIQYDENEKNLIAKVNSQVRTLKGYNCRKSIRNYIDLLPSDAQNIIKERIKMVN